MDALVEEDVFLSGVGVVVVSTSVSVVLSNLSVLVDSLSDEIDLEGSFLYGVVWDFPDVVRVVTLE